MNLYLSLVFSTTFLIRKIDQNIFSPNFQKFQENRRKKYQKARNTNFKGPSNSAERPLDLSKSGREHRIGPELIHAKHDTPPAAVRPLKSVDFGPSGSQNRVQRRTFVSRRFQTVRIAAYRLYRTFVGGGHSGGQKRSRQANITPKWTNIAPKMAPTHQHGAQNRPEGPTQRPKQAIILGEFPTHSPTFKDVSIRPYA